MQTQGEQIICDVIKGIDTSTILLTTPVAKFVSCPLRLRHCHLGLQIQFILKFTINRGVDMLFH